MYCFPAWKIIRFLEISKEEQIQLLHKEHDEYPNETSSVSHDFDNQKLESRYELYKKTVSLWWKAIFAIIANFRNNSIDEQLRLTADIKHVFEFFEVFVNNFTEGNVTIVKERYLIQSNWSSSRFQQLFEIKQFMRDTLKCFSVQSREEFRELNYTDVLRQPYLPRTIFAVGFNSTIPDYAGVLTFGVTGNDPLSATLDGFYVHMREIIISLTYDSYESKLLEYSYQTDCRNYSKDNFVSQADCHEKCIKKVSFESPSSLNMMPTYVTLQGNETNPSLKLAPVYEPFFEGVLDDNYTASLKRKTQEVLLFCDKKMLSKGV